MLLRPTMVVLLMACSFGGIAASCSSSVGAPPARESLPSPGEDSVFGLSWDDSEEKLRSGGVIKGKAEPFRGELGRMYAPARLPRGFEDANWYALFFNQQGELLRIACVGDTFKDDPEGVAARKRYEELKEIISRKIPIVGTFEESPQRWARPQDWWASIKSGKAHWATGFRGQLMEAVLEIRAESDTTGSYSLMVDHLPRMQQLDQLADESEKSAF
jgi:hypothetical protein